MTGKVESLHKKKDSDNPRPTFGFIKPEGGGDSIFFIPTSMQQTSPVNFDDLRPGMKVDFTIIDSDKGPRAIEVIVTDRRIGGGEGRGMVDTPARQKRG